MCGRRPRPPTNHRITSGFNQQVMSHLLARVDAQWTTIVERAMASVRTLPTRLARSLRPRSPTVARALEGLQVDAPLILCLAVACLAVQTFASEDIRLSFFSVAKPIDMSPVGAFRLIGQVIGHTSWSHLHGNLVLLLLVGPPCEVAFGPGRLSKIILWTALASSASHILLAAPNRIQTGASGVVFAMILLNSLLQRQAAKVPITFVLTATLWLHREIFYPVEGVAHTAHLAGAGVGTFFGHRMHIRRTWWGGSRREFSD